MDYTKTLAKYAVNLRYKDLPQAVVDQAKMLTLHVIGVSLAGCQIKQGKEAITLAKDMGGEKRESTIWGDGTKVSCVQAAFANGTLADVLDWEDCSWTGHPSAGAIPAALAVGEKIESGGKDFITALVAGYDLYQRIAMAVQPSAEHWRKTGWGLTSWQIFAAAIPAAKLLGLDAKKMAQAIGIAGALTPIVNRKIALSRSDMYHYQHGLTCRDGVVSGLIAKAGINALEDMLDGDLGYWVTISDICTWDWMTKNLGKDFLIMETLIKHWPVNMWVQQFLDIVDQIRNREKIVPDEVEEIVVSPDYQKAKGASRMLYKPEGYSGITDAQFSIPYCIGALLLEPKTGPNWFAKEKLNDPKLLELAGKVKATGEKVSPLDSFALFQQGRYPEAQVEIRMKDGRRFIERLRYNKGHPKNRMTVDEVKDRFRLAASFTLEPDRIEKAIQKITNLESVNNVSEIAEITHN
jgi:2-methylcitrate dehydratase PrpD